MAVKDMISLILGVLKDFRVIGTVVAMLLVIEFAKYVANYRKKPPKPKKEKKDKKAAPAPKKEAGGEGGGEGDSGGDGASDQEKK